MGRRLQRPEHGGGAFPTGDITLWFSEKHSGSTSLLYTSILHSAEFSMCVFRADDYRLSVPMTLLDTRTKNVDQPRVRAETVREGPTEARTGSTSASTTGLAGLPQECLGGFLARRPGPFGRL